jgi:carbamoyl-phosphate synthase large subunit
MRPFTKTVAVTGLNATDNPGPGVAVIRALRQSPNFQGKIVGLAYDALDPGLYLPGLVDAAFLIPYPSAGREALFARLQYICENYGIDVLIPTLDSELPALVGQEEALREMGIETYLPRAQELEKRAKANLYRLNDDYHLPVPKSVTLTSVEPLFSLHERMKFPVVVKSVFYGAETVYSPDEAVAAFHRAAAKWGMPVIVQQHVKGEEYNVAAIGDGEGGLIGAVAMKKILLTDLGKGWAGVTIADNALLDLAAGIVKALSWRGPCEIEVIRDDAGQFHLLEINPRFPAWIDLTAGAGQNQPLAAVRLAMGEEVEPLLSYTTGMAFVRISIDQILPISEIAAISTIGEVVSASRKSA